MMRAFVPAFLLSIFATFSIAGTLDRIAEAYVKLVLAVGQHDPDYVDAYYGPAAWREAAEKERKPLSAILSEATSLVADLDTLDVSRSTDTMSALRREYLSHQLSSLAARVEMLQGRKFTFDEESRLLYDAVAPTYSADHFDAILKQLDPLLPGRGTLQERYEKFRSRFVIPKSKLDTVFKTAIAECRRRTKNHISLPANESFTVEFVKDKPWGAYNWYKGESRSVIQVNTDLPNYIDRAIDLAAHEGYPGHHVYNSLLEDRLVRRRGWVEFTVYALFSPQSLIAEGSANYGVNVVISDQEKSTFERRVLFPLAALDTGQVETYSRVTRLVHELSYAGNEAARRYLDGTMERDSAVQWLEKYELMTPERAQKRLDFVDRYRTYVINYNLGEDLVKRYIESRSHTVGQRWKEFEKLLSSPRLPSGLGSHE